MKIVKNFIQKWIIRIVFLILIIGYFACGGFSKTKEAINNYKNPTRSEFVETEKYFADFSKVSSDFQLCRNFNILGYRKVTAKYLPTGEKIVIVDLKNEKNISPKDFEDRKVDKKVNQILDKVKDTTETFEYFQVVQRGTFVSRNRKIPFVRYEAKLKGLPTYIDGIIAAYSSNGDNTVNTTKVISTMSERKNFNAQIVQTFIASLKM